MAGFFRWTAFLSSESLKQVISSMRKEPLHWKLGDALAIGPTGLRLLLGGKQESKVMPRNIPTLQVIPGFANAPVFCLWLHDVTNLGPPFLSIVVPI